MRFWSNGTRQSQFNQMNCNIVLHDNSRGWIIEKMARSLAAEIEALGHRADVGTAPSNDANINHVMMFTELPSGLPTHSTVAITHIDDSRRLEMARSAVSAAEVAICMSSMTAKQLVNDGLPRDKIVYVLPAHDGGIAPRRLVVGLTTRLYSDGRKREALLVRLARDMDLSAFHFEVFGTGWEATARTLRQAGALVTVTSDANDALNDYQRIRERIPHFDYYLYTGLDEGSMGTLDALSAGVKTIVTPQGYHVDLPHAITHPFWTYEQLRAVFESIREERSQRTQAVENLTWRKYAESHLVIWQAMLSGRAAALPQLLGQESLAPLGGCCKDQDGHMRSERRRLRLRTLRRYSVTQANWAIRRWLKRSLPKVVTRRLSRSDTADNP